jgi:hypothetical protein
MSCAGAGSFRASTDDGAVCALQEAMLSAKAISGEAMVKVRWCMAARSWNKVGASSPAGMKGMHKDR